MNREENFINQLDWLTIVVYLIMIILGWLNIYAAIFDEELNKGIFDLSANSGKQAVRIGAAIILILIILILDFKLFESFTYVFYGITIILLIAVLFIGTEVSGSRSWFQFAGISIQPSEFAKFATALMLAKHLTNPGVKIEKLRHLVVALFIIFIPAALTILQGDTGTAMVFSAFLLVLYREGMNPTILLVGVFSAIVFIVTLLTKELYLMIGIGVVTLIISYLLRKNRRNIILVVLSGLLLLGVVKSVNFVFDQVLKPYQQSRIMVLINPDADPLGYGWNVTQSKIAIGSGGFSGKGFLNGTQTKFDFVPEQSTDFIFCTIGEEHGWIGGFILIALFIILIFRILAIAERQKTRFARIYGYGVAMIFFFHFAVNIAMTVGFFPVIGIPLPFFSYGGSSLWGFTILLFILLKLDGHRMQLLER